MPSIGRRCHQLRVHDENRNWRIIYRLGADAVVIAEVFAKTTGRTPRQIIATCQRRLRLYDEARE